MPALERRFCAVETIQQLCLSEMQVGRPQSYAIERGSCSSLRESANQDCRQSGKFQCSLDFTRMRYLDCAIVALLRPLQIFTYWSELMVLSRFDAKNEVTANAHFFRSRVWQGGSYLALDAKLRSRRPLAHANRVVCRVVKTNKPNTVN